MTDTPKPITPPPMPDYPDGRSEWTLALDQCFQRYDAAWLAILTEREAALTAERDAAVADARRYRWLREHYSSLLCTSGRGGGLVGFAVSLQQPKTFTPDMLDAAIDAALNPPAQEPRALDSGPKETT